MAQSRNADRRWSRALQHEHSLRLQLQDNMETLANQMHGLESEARASVQDGVYQATPSTSLVAGQVPDSEVDGTTVEVDRMRAPDVLKLRGADRAEPMDEITEESDDEDKFFDAPETTQAEEKNDLNTFVPGHKRDVSSVSVNEALVLTSTPEDDQLPVSRERTMSVS